MTCREPTSATTCSGSSPTGQQLQYDGERRLTHWQNAPSNPTSSADDLYNGSGNGHALSRMAHAVRIWDSAVG